jgi:hypothetical protein
VTAPARAGVCAVLGALATAGCAGREPAAAAPAAHPLCEIETTVGVDKAPRDRAFPANYWFVLLLHGYRSSGEIPRPAKDCSGWPIKLESDGCATDPAPEALTATPLTARDLVVTNLGDTRRLVWAITDRLADGQAQGPVALAEIGSGSVAVRSLGLLRAYPDNVSLRLDHLGTGTVLVAEGERCAEARPGTPCDRAVRVVPLVGSRFIPKPLVDDKGACLGTALLSVRSGSNLATAGGARYQLEASVTFSPDAITIREQLALTQQHGTDVGSTAFVTRVQAERQVTMRGGSLVGTGPSLLSRWLAQQGATAAAP